MYYDGKQLSAHINPYGYGTGTMAEWAQTFGVYAQQISISSSEITIEDDLASGGSDTVLAGDYTPEFPVRWIILNASQAVAFDLPMSTGEGQPGSANKFVVTLPAGRSDLRVTKIYASGTADGTITLIG